MVLLLNEMFRILCLSCRTVNNKGSSYCALLMAILLLISFIKACFETYCPLAYSQYGRHAIFSYLLF
jgi:membrane-associated PAP2 superfamily phosphatase